MNTGLKLDKFAGHLLLCIFVLTLSSFSSAAATQHHKKAAKKPPPPPLPTGPTGPLQQQIPLDSIPAVPPQVTYKDGQLTIVAPNSTMGDILRAVHKQTGAEIEIPAAADRVVTHLGPGPAREVMADLLNGSRFNYVLLGSQEDTNLLTRVVLVAKSTTETAAVPNNQAAEQQPGAMPNGNIIAQQQQEAPPDATDADTAEENADDNPDQPVEAEQPANTPPDQAGPKTPQQMLQEMQQRQMQLQQQQPSNQPPLPGSRPPQEQQ